MSEGWGFFLIITFVFLEYWLLKALLLLLGKYDLGLQVCGCQTHREVLVWFYLFIYSFKLNLL